MSEDFPAPIGVEDEPVDPVDPDDPDDPADEPVDDPADEPVDDPAAEPQSPSSQAIVRALEKEEQRHAKALAKALGVDVSELHECPTCQAMGYTPEPIAGEEELRLDPFTSTCERCNGYGEVRTGAKPPGLVTIPCAGCAGSGYVQRPENPATDAVPANGDTPEYAAPSPLPSAEPELDEVALLRARGYVVVEPPASPPPVPA
jgi:hypothetical protein